METGDSRGGAAELEVHVAKIVFAADDVGEQGVARNFVSAEFGDKSAADSGDGFADGNAGVHQGENACANACHRSRTVGFHDLAADADGVGEIGHLGQDGRDAALGECAVSDLAPARAAGASGFAHAEWGKVIMQDESLAGFAAGVAIELLGFVGRGKSGQAEGLCLAALEKGAAVASGEQPGLRAERANFIITAPIAADLLIEDTDAKGLLLKIVEGLAHLELCGLWERLENSGAHFLFECFHGLLTGDLAGGIKSRFDAVAGYAVGDFEKLVGNDKER